MLDTIGTFLVETILQYFLSKGLDKIGNKKIEVELSELFDETYKCLCNRNGWEYNIDTVHSLLQKNNITMDQLSDRNYINTFLCEILGEDYAENYDGDILDQWDQCWIECILKSKFEEVYKRFQIDKIRKLEKDSQNKITSEKAWEIRETAESEKAVEKGLNEEFDQKMEYELAIQAMEEGEYEEAIDIFKKTSIWNTDKKIKYLCYYNEAYCYGKIARDAEGYKKAIRFFKKAEKYADASSPDVVLLYRNIALLYIYIGEEQEKVLNYKRANDYFEKVLECAKEDDKYYIIDVTLHIARNYMDMCDEVSMDEVKENLSIAFVLMLTVCLVNGDELSEEHAYILMHNMGRLFYHISEKEDMPQLRKQAQELYREVLQMEFVKRDKLKFALVNGNLGMAYQCDCAEGTENLEKALSHYELAVNIYKGLGIYGSKHSILNLQLNMAEVYSQLYQRTEKEEHFAKAERLLNSMEKQVDAMPYNSLYLRIKLSLMQLYYRRIRFEEEEIEREKWIEQADKVSSGIDAILVSADYSKYKYTYFLLKARINVFCINSKTDVEVLNSYKNKLQQIADETKDSNKNLYKAAEELIDEYEKAIQCFSTT